MRWTWHCSPDSAYLIQDEICQPLTQGALRSRFDKARTLAKVDFQFRDIRAKAATDTGDLAHSQTLLGHKNRDMTEHYVKARMGDRVAALRLSLFSLTTASALSLSLRTSTTSIRHFGRCAKPSPLLNQRPARTAKRLNCPEVCTKDRHGNGGSELAAVMPALHFEILQAQQGLRAGPPQHVLLMLD